MTTQNLAGQFVAWFDRQMTLGIRPGLSGVRLRCQYLTNAAPSLVLSMGLLYLALFSVAGVPALVQCMLLQLPVPLAGQLWFRRMQTQGRMPTYWQACFICQLSVLAVIFGGQGTVFNSHAYFLFFSLTAPLMIPVADRVGLTIICTETLALYLFFEVSRWPADPSVYTLQPDRLQFLRLCVVVSCVAILFVTMLMSEHILDGLERKTVRMANTDVLTGLPNRRHFHQALEGAHARAERGAAAYCLALIDIDHFKSINDAHGHDAGDEVLKQVAHLLLACQRKGDQVARIGGEEFAVIIENADIAQAEHAMERTRRTVADSPLAITLGMTTRITISIGVAAWQRGTTEKDLVGRVDQALYGAKRLGRNRVCQEPHGGVG